MSCYPDLSPYAYHVEIIDPKLLNIGWLDAKHPFTQGPVSEEFLERLWIYSHVSVRAFRGFHDCDFCLDASRPTLADKNDEVLRLGSAEIRVPGEDGVVYAAPNLIYHYVTTHHYQPPTQFIEAVLNHPHPSSPEYIQFLDQLAVDYRFIDSEGEIIAAGGWYRELATDAAYRASVKDQHKKRYAQ